MMFAAKLVALAALVALVSAAPLESTTPAVVILKQAQDGPNPDGSYSYSYETSNGISVQEQGQQVAAQNPEAEFKEANSVQGSYSFPDQDGNVLTVSYVADENGYQPQGAHLPVAPTVPEGILRALEWIAAHPEEDKQQ